MHDGRREFWISPQRAEQVEAHRHRRQQVAEQPSIIERLVAFPMRRVEARCDRSSDFVTHEVDAGATGVVLLDPAADRAEATALLLAPPLKTSRPTVKVTPLALVPPRRPTPGRDVGPAGNVVGRFAGRHVGHVQMLASTRARRASAGTL